MDFILVAAGLVLLFLGGEGLVRGSVAISQKLGISAILIGVVVVGFGTSAPELLVSVQAVLNNQPDIALGNVVGSNIANVLLILGVASMITPIFCTDVAIIRDAVAATLAGTLLVVLSYLGVLDQMTGAVMVFLLLGYLAYSYRAEQEQKSKVIADDRGTEVIQRTSTVHEKETKEFTTPQIPFLVSVLMSIGGIAMLVFGADMLVRGASSLARAAGISEAVIGLSLVAMGTSLPELATAIAAATKRHTDVIVGNVLGSNLFNIMSILGISAMVHPIPVGGQIADFDIPFSLITMVLTLGIILTRRRITRLNGFLYLLIYTGYISWLYGSGALLT